ALKPDALPPHLFPGLDGTRLVFVNGHYSPELSWLPAPAAAGGVRVLSLAQALTQGDDGLRQHLTRYADFRDEPFTALNTAFVADGAVVFVPRGSVANQPIHLIYVTTETVEPLASHPRNLVVTDTSSQATII